VSAILICFRSLKVALVNDVSCEKSNLCADLCEISFHSIVVNAGVVLELEITVESDNRLVDVRSVDLHDGSFLSLVFLKVS